MSDRADVPTALPRAMLLGSAGRLPFNGHLYVERRGGPARAHVAARVASGARPPVAWDAVLALHEALEGCTASDRFALCRDAWERLLTIDRARLGPAEGRDLCLLMVVEDPDGELISGVGLGRLMTLERGRLRDVVDLNHPLLGEPGLPEQLPKVLGPQAPGPVYLARCFGEPVEPPSAREALALCGVRA
ncbi:MAG: hypothetical protein H6739_38765 [Alphaproteobacteria bacterium]|nr:hypothetical protein [Alphaproteobacteria bacterium]